MASQVYSQAGTGTWLCPAGVTSVRAQCTGGGFAGTAGQAGGFGGGGGEYAEDPDVAVTGGRTYRWTAGTAGGNSSFAGDTVTVTAHGANGRNGGTGSVSPVHFGGGGGAVPGSGAGGGGGSSAGTGAPGNGGTAGSSGGAGGSAPAGGGAGGNGATSITGAAGANGGAPGGGGGGGSHGQPGGAGAPGQVILTYTAPFQPQIPDFPAGFAPMPADFDAWLQSPASFLTGRIVFRATLGTATALNGDTLLPFSNILEDPLGGWIGGTVSAWEAPAGYTGTYEVSLTVSCAANAAGPVAQARVAVNGTQSMFTVDRAWVPVSVVPGIASGAVPVQLYGGLDQVSGYCFLSGGTGVTATGTGRLPAMQITWLSQ